MPKITYTNKCNIFHTQLHAIIFNNLIEDTYNDHYKTGEFYNEFNKLKETIKNVCFNQDLDFNIVANDMQIQVTFG